MNRIHQRSVQIAVLSLLILVGIMMAYGFAHAIH